MSISAPVPLPRRRSRRERRLLGRFQLGLLVLAEHPDRLGRHFGADPIARQDDDVRHREAPTL